MQNKPALNKKYFYFNFALWLGCNLASLFVKPFARARQVELSQLCNVSTDTILLISAIVNFFLLGVGFYFSVRAFRHLTAASALSPQEIQERERRKRELAEEDARARAWVHSSDT
jgi:hypothetical protein